MLNWIWASGAAAYRMASATKRLVQVCSSISFALVAALSPTAWRKISCTFCQSRAVSWRGRNVYPVFFSVSSMSLKFELCVGALLEDLRGLHGMIGNVAARLDHRFDHAGNDRRIGLDVVAAGLQAGE